MSRHRINGHRVAATLFALSLLTLPSYAQAGTRDGEDSPKVVDLPKEGCPTGWSTTPQLSAGATQSKTSTQKYTLDVLSVRNWYKDAQCTFGSRLIIHLAPSFEGAYQKGKASLTTSRELGEAQYTHSTPSDSLSLAAIANGYHNKNLGIYSQQELGLGATYFVGRLEAGTDLRYIGEHFYKAENLNLVGMGLYETRTFVSARLKPLALRETITVIPVLNKSKATIARASIGIILPIHNTSWVLSFPIDDDFTQNAPRGYRQNYFSASINLAKIQLTPAPPK